jgi:hypothetical protein
MWLCQISAAKLTELPLVTMLKASDRTSAKTLLAWPTSSSRLLANTLDSTPAYGSIAVTLPAEKQSMSSWQAILTHQYATQGSCIP